MAYKDADSFKILILNCVIFINLSKNLFCLIKAFFFSTETIWLSLEVEKQNVGSFYMEGTCALNNSSFIFKVVLVLII